ncbi:MAG: DnaJ domain-containing protein [Gammaproteobacteria bacterium]|nr:DnaJ domain-containing protein [Gammaproteobacteria bacterium]
MARLLLLFVAVVGAILVVNWLLKEDPKKVAAVLRKSFMWIAVGGLILLAATGRLHWFFALLGAMLPVLGRILSLLRYVPLVSHLYTLYQNAQTQRTPGGQATTGGSSQVETRFLRMRLEHDSGDMDGDILEGRHAGKRLGELSLPDLVELLHAYRDMDEESAALLEAYLARAHQGDWEADAEPRPPPSAGRMTADEAREILGVEPSASEKEIIAAHRRLMQKMHPDRGGSNYLAAKINQAKDVLLGT